MKTSVIKATRGHSTLSSWHIQSEANGARAAQEGNGMALDTLNGYIEKARTFAHEHYSHPKFAGYTETEVAKGSAMALSFVNTYLSAKKANCLPVPDSEIGRILAVIEESVT